MSTPLSIAIVSREYPPFFGGGIGTYARWIVPALAAQGVRVHVITQAYDRTCPRVTTEGLVTTHRLPIGMGYGGWPNAAARFSMHAGRLVASLARTNRIQVAEYAECEAASIGSLLLDRDRPPTIVQLHTPSEQLFVLRSHTSQTLDVPHRYYFELERLGMHLADEILAPSQFIADWAHEQYGFERPPSVIPYATGPLPPPPPPADESGGRIIFFAGRIEPRKGVESLIIAANELMRTDPSVRLRLAGADTSGAPDGGSMRAYLQSMIGDQARTRIQFLGRLNANEIRTEYTNASICAIPSLWENFPNTCIESMSHARPVLVSDQGGMREMIGESVAGRTFIAGDPIDLQRVLAEMFNESSESLAQRGRVARKQIETMCNPIRVAKARIEHYRMVIDRQAQSAVRSQSHGTLSAWKGIEDTLCGNIDSFDAPKVSGPVRQWIEQGAGCMR